MKKTTKKVVKKPIKKVEEVIKEPVEEVPVEEVEPEEEVVITSEEPEEEVEEKLEEPKRETFTYPVPVTREDLLALHKCLKDLGVNSIGDLEVKASKM